MTVFGTAGIRGSVPDDVDIATAVSVGRGVGAAAQEGTDGGPAGSPTVVVGRDTRVTGEGLLAGVISGLISQGVSVSRLGRVPTPVLAHASLGCRGIMVTASHNPPADNGFKLFRDGVEYESPAERAVADRLEASSSLWAEWGSVSNNAAAVGHYLDAVSDYLRDVGESPTGLSVAIDVGNGAAGATTPSVVRRTGARPVTLDANPDGRFPARRPKPTNDAINRFCEFVADGDVTMGIAHDGDGDRVVVVDESGAVVHEDTVLAILAEYYVRAADVEGTPTVITTPNASTRIDERVSAAGGRIERVSLGAIHEGMAATDPDHPVVFAGEPWKHCHPQFGGWLDGTVTAGLLVRLVAERSLSALRAPVRERPYLKDNVACPRQAHASAMAALPAALRERFDPVDVATDHGIRIELDDGSWVLCRPSGTEPCIRIYVESNRAEELLERVRACVSAVVDPDDPA